MKIVVVGTGGVGGYYGGLLARTGHEVHFVARGAHLDAIRAGGLQVKSTLGNFVIKPARATDNPADCGQSDLVLICTKTYSADKAARQVLPILRSDTTVLGLQNGIEASDRIGRIVGFEHMLAGTTWLSSAIESPGVIRQFSESRRIVIGELDHAITPRLQAVHDAFQQAGITTEISTDIRAVLWTKLLFIAAAAGFGSLTGLPMAAYRAVSETRALITDLMREIAAVAAAHGIALEPDVIDNSLAFMDKAGPSIKASMQLDVEAHRPTELESLIGVIGRLGREHGVQTPVADMIYGCLRPADLLARAT